MSGKRPERVRVDKSDGVTDMGPSLYPHVRLQSHLPTTRREASSTDLLYVNFALTLTISRLKYDRNMFLKRLLELTEASSLSTIHLLHVTHAALGKYNVHRWVKARILI